MPIVGKSLPLQGRSGSLSGHFRYVRGATACCYNLRLLWSARSNWVTSFN